MESPPAEGRKLLICDDDETLTILLESIFEAEGYQVRTAHDGIDCLVKHREERPELLILDLDMPFKDGFEVLDALRKEGALEKLKVVVVSGRERPDDRDRVKEFGIQDIVIKPFESKALLDLVDRVFHPPEVAGEG